MFESLDFVYVPTADVDATAATYVDALGATMEWRVRGMGTVVACLRVAGSGPAMLLSGHLEGDIPILVYRVADYTATVAALRAQGLTTINELEIPTARAPASSPPVASVSPSTSWSAPGPPLSSPDVSTSRARGPRCGYN